MGVPIGVVKLRHYLNDFLRQSPGHLGYGIRKEYRGHRLASQGLTFEKAKSIISELELYVACYKDNPASLRVMQKMAIILIIKMKKNTMLEYFK